VPARSVPSASGPSGCAARGLPWRDAAQDRQQSRRGSCQPGHRRAPADARGWRREAGVRCELLDQAQPAEVMPIVFGSPATGARRGQKTELDVVMDRPWSDAGQIAELPEVHHRRLHRRILTVSNFTVNIRRRSRGSAMRSIVYYLGFIDLYELMASRARAREQACLTSDRMTRVGPEDDAEAPSLCLSKLP
jgi:hypothetical protein